SLTGASFGGGIYNFQGTMTARNTIVSGNTLSGTASDVLGAFAAGSDHNLIQDSTNAGGLTSGVDANIVGIDPLLGLLADNGGATPLGSAALNGSGVATFSTSALAAGDHSITAVYGGGRGYIAGNSAPLTQTVLADSDGDGVPDISDGCPNDANKTTPGA